MGSFEKKFVHETEWKAFMIDWIRFINNIFMIWKGTKALFILAIFTFLIILTLLYHQLGLEINFFALEPAGD